MRHFLDTQDFTKPELETRLDLTALLKAADRDGARPRLLEGASLGMIFEEPSTRTRTLSTTPADDGFMMPTGWAPHAGTWMLWPERPDNWRWGAKPAQAAFTAVATAIARFRCARHGLPRTPPTPPTPRARHARGQPGSRDSPQLQ